MTIGWVAVALVLQVDTKLVGPGSMNHLIAGLALRSWRRKSAGVTSMVAHARRSRNDASAHAKTALPEMLHERAHHHMLTPAPPPGKKVQVSFRTMKANNEYPLALPLCVPFIRT